MLGVDGHGRGVRQDGVRGEQSEEEDEDDDEEEVEAVLSWWLNLHRLFLCIKGVEERVCHFKQEVFL